MLDRIGIIYSLLLAALCSLTSTNRGTDDYNLCLSLKSDGDTWEGTFKKCLDEDARLISESSAYVLSDHGVSSYNLLLLTLLDIFTQ